MEAMMQQPDAKPGPDAPWVVNIQELFKRYDQRYFHSLVSSRATLAWSGTLKT
jgi:hypothetical protein